MRTRRIILNTAAIYHCMSRTVNGEAWFGRREKEVMRKMIAQVAEFSGVEILTYCIMKNHFHVLVRVVPSGPVSDEELIRRYRILYPTPTRYSPDSPAELEKQLAKNDEAGRVLRRRLMLRMGNVSQFMKTLKQRFSTWFNASRERYGPVWSDRFKSVLVEGHGFCLQTVAAYIDLNPVRAGIVADPKDYRFCGYAEAVANQGTARDRIHFLMFGNGTQSPTLAMQSYRELLFGKGAAAVSNKQSIAPAKASQVLQNEAGVLPGYQELRCRIRYFTEGAILGSQEFVQSHLEKWRRLQNQSLERTSYSLPFNESTIASVKRCRGPIFS